MAQRLNVWREWHYIDFPEQHAREKVFKHTQTNQPINKDSEAWGASATVCEYVCECWPKPTISIRDPRDQNRYFKPNQVFWSLAKLFYFLNIRAAAQHCDKRETENSRQVAT